MHQINTDSYFEKILASKKTEEGKTKFLVKMKNEPIERCKWIIEEKHLIIPENLKENFYRTKLDPVVIKQIRGRGRPVKYWEKREEFLKIKPKVKLIVDESYFKNGISKKRERPDKDQYSDEADIYEYNQEESETSVRSNEDSLVNFEVKSSKMNILNEQIDYPEKIKEAKMIKNTMCYLVQWKIRTDGVTPNDCWVPSNIFKEKFSEYMKQYSNIK
jgi:hypothetical protein